jgi:hypothetical protein
MSTDYIFCPLCGGIKWLVDKSRFAEGGRLTSHKCGGCKKFMYTDHTVLVDHQILIGITQTTRYSVEATIDPYRITVFYHAKSTQFQDIETNNVIMVVNTAVSFNWYKSEELVNKIKKYVVFS